MTDTTRLAEHLAGWLRREIEASHGEGAVLGLSGGIDSAVVGALARRACGERVLAVAMPCHSDPTDADDAALVAGALDLPLTTVDLSPVYDALLAQLDPACEASLAGLGEAVAGLSGHRLATANLKPRLRMTTLYAFANLLGYRVLGSSNLDELTIGYFTKFGDGGADLLPLGSLTKGEVRDLARELGVPERVVEKPPSAGLWPGQTDEGEMGLTYEQLDAFVRGGEVAPEARARIEALRDASAHKRALQKIAPLPDEA